MMHQFKSGVLILGIAALSSGSAALTTGKAFAADVKSIAILTPEEGTDYGWNQQGIDAAKAAGAKENVKVLVGQNLGYGDVRPTMRELAEDGANLLIAHASGYNTAAPEIGAEMNVAVAVVDKPGTGVPGKIADYTLSGHQGAYLAGRLAAKMSKTGTVGIVVSGEPPSWNSQSTAFAEGAKAENPKIVVRYAVIGPAAYSDAAGGKRVTDAVIAAGADVIFGQGNGSSFGMIQSVETAKAPGGQKVWFIDVIGDKSKIDKGNLLSSVVWDMTPVYTAMIQDLKSGKFGSYEYGIKLADDSVHLLKTSHIPDQTWSDLQALRQDIIDGKIKVEAHFDPGAVHAMVTEVPVAK